MQRRTLLAALALAFLPAAALAQLPPQKALESLVVADGLQVELFAHEPQLINPTSIDVDHIGRVWVCEAVNYRRLPPYNRPILREAGDRIVILTDKDGDGKADDSTVFYQGKDLYAPLGIAVAPIASHGVHPRGGEKDHGDKPRGSPVRVFVCQSPDILLFEDLDGNGKADGPPKKFLTGFRGFDHDHGVHGINIGPDGKLYFTVGDSGVDGLKSSDGKGRVWKSNTTDCRAGTVWRCDFDGKNLELIAHNFRNNYECCVNSFGEVWLSDNDDDGNQQTRICFVMPGGDYGYHPRGPGQSHWHEEQPGIVHKVIRTGFGSPTGICFYEGTLLPKRFHGQLLHTDAGPRELRCFHLKPKGAGYEATQENLVTSNDSWFRPSDVCVAPDGSAFIADWYDPGVGGHGMGDWTRGRIYRVTPKGHKGYKVPKVDLATKEGSLSALASPSLATRALARQRFSTEDSGAALRLLADGLGGDIKLAARSWWLVQQIAARKDAPYLKEVSAAYELFSSGPKPLVFGAFETRVLHDVFGKTVAMHKMDEAWPVVVTISPILNREWMLSLRHTGVEDMKPYFYLFAKHYDGQDHFYRAALNIACGTDPARRDAILADFDKHFPEWNDKVADLVWELRPKAIIARLDQKLVDPKLTAAQKGRILEILAGSDAASGGPAVLSLLGNDNTPAELKSQAWKTLIANLPNRWSALKADAGLERLMARWMSGRPAEERIRAIQLIALAEKRNLVTFLTSVARNEKEPLPVRRAAVEALPAFKSKHAAETLGRLIDDRGLRQAAVAALGAMQSPESLAVLQTVVTNDRESSEARAAAVAAVAASRPGTDWLLKLKQDGAMPEAIAAEAGRLLRNSPFQGQRNKALLLFPAPGKLDPARLPPLSALAKARGETGRGKDLMAASLKGEAQCLKCHTVRGIGGQVGPDLSMIGMKASRENLLESILVPSKAIADQFLQYQVETRTGQQVMGLLVQQGPAGVTLRDANGKDHTFAKADIESMTKSQVSIMPADIVKAFTEDELLDVAEYLLTLKTPSLTPDFWHIAGPFPNDESDSGLDAVHEPEKKVDLSATYHSPQRKRGNERADIRWTKVQRNADGYVDLMAHYAPNSAHVMSYLYREIESPADQEATIALGTDDGAKLWLNGAKVYEARDHFAATPERAKVTVKLKKGVNTILLKIVNGHNPHGFYLTILSGQELKAGR